MKKPCLRRAQGTSEKHGVKNGCSGLCGGSAPLRSPSDGDRPLEGPSAFVTNMTKKLGTGLEVEGALKDQLLVCGVCGELTSTTTLANRALFPCLIQNVPDTSRPFC
jgi:hypothetical protein